MGVPTSEVGYTIATTRMETTKVHKNIWWHWGGGTLLKMQQLEENMLKRKKDRDTLMGPI